MRLDSESLSLGRVDCVKREGIMKGWRSKDRGMWLWVGRS